MPIEIIAQQPIEFDAEGYMVDHRAWNMDIAQALATHEGIPELTLRHIIVLNFMRKEFEATGDGPSLRKLTREIGVPTKELYDLFPNGPAKTAAKIAGIKRPRGCL
jgi:TusE/DsrC/DsvC family sulfur relay protein